MPKFFLIAALLLPPVLPQAGSVVFAMLAAALAAFYVRSRSTADVMQFAWPLLILTVPLGYGLFVDYPFDAWIRDVALFAKPVLVLLAAMLFGHVVAMRSGPAEVERLALWGALLSTVIYILFGIHGRTETTALIDFEPLWNRGGFYVWIPALLLVGLNYLMGVRLTLVHLLCGAFLSVAVLLSQSRSVVMAIAVGILVAVVRTSGRGVRLFRVLIVGVVLAGVGLTTMLARYEATPGVGEVNEMEFSAENIGDENQRWRGFEAFQAVSKWKAGNTFEHAFGHGMGSQIELGATFFLAGRLYDAVPQSHNGYATLLVKTGVVGIAAFLLFYLSLIVITWRTVGVTELQRRPAVLAALASAFSIPVMAYTVEGVTSFGSFDPMLTFIGAVLGANTWRIRRWRPVQSATWPATTLQPARPHSR